MTTPIIYNYTISTEELAMALSLVNRPDLGRMVLLDNFGELPLLAIEERLKAASHSLLSRKYVYIGERGLAILEDELQNAIAPLILFDGMLQVVVHETLPAITNFHLGLKKRFVAHWMEQGVVHRIVHAETKHLPQMVSELVSLPQKNSADLDEQIKRNAFRFSMETFADLTEMDFEAGLKILIENGLDAGLAKALLTDLLEPVTRGSINYLPIDSKDMERANSMSETAGLFFVKGKSAWILAFSGIGTPQVGSLLTGTIDVFEKCIRELVEKRNNAFV